MKANIIKKGILILVVVSLLAIGFTGCTITFFPTTGTVYITVEGEWWYNIYMDEQKKCSGIQQGETCVLYNIPVGNHFFEAIDTAGSMLGYDSVRQYIHRGVNNVNLNPQSSI
ncbi:MAG: hypothetical protein U9O59_05545 [Actinomycetota bacterium]|nr:hypothetical protein [Actinomycetota bacterium]